jgi:hypothetical protein
VRTALLIGCAALLGAQPRIDNAKLETRAAGPSLEAALRSITASQADAAWIGYTVAQISGERQMCATVSLEGAPEFVVMYRVSAGQIEKIRSYGTDCRFDAGGLPVYWLTGVDGEQSAAFLAGYVVPGKSAVSSSALSALARHRDGAPALIGLAKRTDLQSNTRQEVMRWLGRSADPRAVKFFEQIFAAR